MSRDYECVWPARRARERNVCFGERGVYTLGRRGRFDQYLHRRLAKPRELEPIGRVR